MQTDTKLTELINKFKNNKNVTEEDINLLKSIATDLKVSQKRVGLNYDHSQLDQEDASNLMQGNKLFFENKSDLNISFNEKGMTNNALIEGDNFYALSKMKEMGKKFEVIYIDPPYNTGNDDLGYEDKRIGSDDGFKHSKWLAFMEPRLQLAHQLLTDDGVIFVSIDDHEQAYLKVMMDKIFGEQNFIGNISRRTRTGTELLTSGIDRNSEYTLIYKKKLIGVLIGEEKNNSKYKNLDNDLNGSWISDNPTVGGNNNKRNFKIVNPYTKQEDVPPIGRHWSFNKEDIPELVKQNKIVFKKNITKGRSFILKRYLKDIKNNYKPLKSYDTYFDNDINTAGNKDLINIINVSSFSYPKPVSFIKKLIKSINNPNAHVLDFFAGTGTTGQAVLELNKEDGGHRQFTLVTSKEREDNIARTITHKRLSKVINGYTTPKGKEVDGIHANLSYYLADIEQLVPEDEVDFGMVDDSVINEDKASTYAIKENAVLVKKFSDSTFLFKVRDHKFTLIGEGVQDNLKLEKYVQKDDELLIYDLGLDTKFINQLATTFNVTDVINLDDSRLPKYLDIEL